MSPDSRNHGEQGFRRRVARPGRFRRRRAAARVRHRSISGHRTVFVHRFCGILSAYGMGMADVVSEAQRPFAGTLGEERRQKRRRRRRTRGARRRPTRRTASPSNPRKVSATDRDGDVAEPPVRWHGHGDDDPRAERLRFAGVSCAVRARIRLRPRRSRSHRRRRTRARGVGKTELLRRVRVDGSGDGEEEGGRTGHDRARVLRGRVEDTPVFLINALGAGTTLEGPAVVMNGTATCVVKPGAPRSPSTATSRST